MACVCLKAIIWALDAKDLPRNALSHVLKGFAQVLCTDFHSLCHAQVAQMAMPLYQVVMGKMSPVDQLFETL